MINMIKWLTNPGFSGNLNLKAKQAVSFVVCVMCVCSQGGVLFDTRSSKVFLSLLQNEFFE